MSVAALVAGLLAAASAQVPPPASVSPGVTLPLEEYQRLHELERRPSLTVIDLLRVEGSFARRDLAVVLTGRASGTLPSVPALQGQGFRLHSCQGEGLVAREDGAFTVTPLAPRFEVRCRVALDGSDRLEAVAAPAVLEVAAAVADGELVASDEGEGRRIAVVRRLEGRGEELPPSVTGRYRVTLLPDESRFLYRLEVRNPARGHHRFSVALRDAEHVESVDARVPWEAAGARYVFDLPPGESTLVLRGRLTAPTFVPPVQASLQYLLLEAHPLLRPSVQTEARRVGAGEVDLPAQYRGAQAFLLAGQGEVTWSVARMEALKTAGFAVNGLSEVLFFGADGQVRGEAVFALDNQGAAALSLPLAGMATFAAIDGEPAFLTRDEGGRLYLPLGQGRQEVVVQEARPFSVGAGLAVARVALPQAGTPASQARVELRYPAEWVPVYEALAPSGRWPIVDPSAVGWAVVLAVATAALLGLGGLRGWRRLALVAALALAAAAWEPVLALGLLLAFGAVLALAAAAVARRLQGAVRAASLAGLGVAALIALVVAAASVHLGAAPASPPEPYAATRGRAELADRWGEPASAPAERKERVAQAALSGGKAEEAKSFEGRPARIQLPQGVRRGTFTRELLAADAAPVVVVMADARLVAAGAWAALLLLVALGLAWRRSLGEAVRGLRARLAV